jgi:hypothetical protein
VFRVGETNLLGLCTLAKFLAIYKVVNSKPQFAN